MRGNRRVLVILGVLLLVVIVGGYFVWSNLNQGGEIPEETGEIPPEERPRTQIVVAAQNIPRGQQLRVEDGAVRMQPWPDDALPAEYFDALDQVDGTFARMEIPNGMPILPRMLGDPTTALEVYGSAAALFGDTGKRAYVIPMDTQGSVAWAIRPGDRVDVLAALKLMPADEEFQTPLPNLFMSLPSGAEGETALSGTYGRFETLPNGQPGLIFPSAQAHPYLVVQLTVQDAVVWQVGIWPDTETDAMQPTGVSAQPQQEGGGLATGAQPPAQATPPPAPVQRSEVEPITLLVTPQDALVLKYLVEMGADLDLALRAANDTAPVITEPVWLSYILDRYQIPDMAPGLPVIPTPVSRLQLTPLAPEAVEE